MNSEPMSGLESMKIIQEMIQKARNQFSENGHLYLLWGWVILICCVAQYLLQHVFQVEQFYLVWMLTWLAFFYQSFYIYRRRKQRTVKTYTDSILAYVWQAFVATMFVSAFVITVLSNKYQFNSFLITGPIIMALYGVPTFISGSILRFLPLKLGGVICWGLALGSVYVPSKFQVLFLAAAVVAAWIVPGYLLQYRYKNQNN